MDRVSRLSGTLTQCSTTPRTTKRYLDELCNQGGGATRDAVLYEEAKLAMASGDMDVATVLLELLPPTHKNTSTYLQQCRTHTQLCKDGILVRDGTSLIQEKLANILNEETNTAEVVKYANALVMNGFNLTNLSGATLYTFEQAADTAEMSEGHRQLFRVFAEGNTPVVARSWMKLLHALNRCAPLVKCMRKKGEEELNGKKGTNNTSNLAAVNDAKEDGDERRTSTSNCIEEDVNKMTYKPYRRTSTNGSLHDASKNDDHHEPANEHVHDDEMQQQLTNIKWRAGESMLFGDDDTAGDDDDH